MTYTTLLPARMGRLELRNRIVFPAMVTNYCSTRGEVTDRLVAYHQERAKGGAGLLITLETIKGRRMNAGVAPTSFIVWIRKRLE